ncbi:AlpA family transcriptional regulator [Ancylobacter aquaticus]|uniref:AlpA family transcriptional regulator n=1 Tax=Ancylobacter aquaticus TaxID=100 RepID=A0A4R1I2Z9_ANCAQ|nr:AlpA family phage regulatory protein [Ancylobacter aquaticus]TCK27995.1 AlpA family transcriptional regulator [Ancylobacter aquaticus]
MTTCTAAAVAANDNHPPIISIKTAAAMTSLSRPAINSLRAAGQFPASVQLGERRIGFVRAEVMDWINQRIAARNGRAA